MSYVFEVNDDTIWSPSMIAGGFFMCQVRHFERILSVASGLTESMSDTIQVDADGLSTILKQAFGFRPNRQYVGERVSKRHGRAFDCTIARRGSTRQGGSRLFPEEWITEALCLSSRNMVSRPNPDSSP